MEFISLGAGVQSTTMLLMACHGELEFNGKYAIFSDTGWEPQYVYDHLEWLKKETIKYSIEVVSTDNGNIREDILEATGGGSRFASLPFFTLDKNGNKGMVRRQCTNEYKIVPVRRKIRELLGYVPKQRVKENINLWMGISTDEIQRVKPSRERWITNKYPLINNDMSRQSCLMWMAKKGYSLPPKSSCIGCPFHNDHMWLEMKRNDQKSWEDAILIDREIKKLPRFKGQAFLHRSCQPLDEVNLGEDQTELDLFTNECEGMCGV